MNETASLMTIINKNKKEKGHVMMAAYEMEQFGMNFCKYHFKNYSNVKMTTIRDDFGKFKL